MNNKKITVADAHCDTLTAFPTNPFNEEKAAWNTEKFTESGGRMQYMAIYTPPEFSGDSAIRFAVQSIGNFNRYKIPEINLIEKKEDFIEEKINIILSLEGASPIINSINNLYAFYKLGVRAMTLTWNHRNFIGDGVDEIYGLTSFGKEVITEMEKLKMIIDVSHLNVAGFDDVVNTISCPFIASHSNSYTIHNHRRNLNDIQINEIVNRKGFIGLNFYSAFIGEPDSDLEKEFLKHIEHFLELGAENILGFGADFDGMDATPFKDVKSYQYIHKLIKDNLQLSDEIIEKIFYKNLLNFTLEYI